jgi:tetratricopeptide (TPR) repeat protein
MNPAKKSRIEYLLTELNENPYDSFTLYALGLEYKDIDIEMSISYFEQLLKSEPDYVSAYYQLGYCYFKTQNIEKAIETLKKGIEVANLKKDSHTLAELKNALTNIELDLDFEN